MWAFRILFGFNALALAVLLYFFLTGLRYAPGSDYMSAWLPILAVAIGGLAGAWALRSAGRAGLAKLLLGLMAVPPFLYLLFVLMFVVLQPDFR